jgi:hypothetical protein
VSSAHWRKEDGEAVARNARRERARARLPAQHFGDLADQLVADVHAEVVVDHVQAVDVHVQDAFRRRLAARGELAADLCLEGGAREQGRQRVEVVRERGRRLARQQLDQALGARVEERGARLAEHHEEAGHAAGRMADRRREDLVGRQLDRADLDLVDHEVAPLQLHPVEQVPVDLGQDLDLRPFAARRLADRDAALGHDQGAQQAAEVVHAGLYHDAELVAGLRVVRILRGHLEQQLEVVVARAQVAGQRVEAGARLELSLQAFERRLHQRLHEAVWTVLAVARQEGRDGDDLALAITEPEDVGRRPLVVMAEAVDACGGRRRGLLERHRDERRRVGPVVVVCEPQRHASRVVEADSEGARHQHPQEMSVRIEIGPGARQVRGQVHGRGCCHDTASPRRVSPSLT